MTSIDTWPRPKLIKAVSNLQEIVSLSMPRKEDYPTMKYIDYYAKTEPYEGKVGGDLLMLINFEKLAKEIEEYTVDLDDVERNNIVSKIRTKNKDKFGILIADSLGHGVSDSAPAYYLHGILTMGLIDDLIRHQEATVGLFERVSTLWHHHISPEYLTRRPYATLTYGEFYESGKFRFVSAGHPCPFVYSNYFDKIVKLEDENTRSSTPLGVMPSKYYADAGHFPAHRKNGQYHVNELTLLGQGDILILYSDGFIEQDGGRKNFAQARLEEVLKIVKNQSAKEIYTALRRELQSFSPIEDDLTLAVIKKK